MKRGITVTIARNLKPPPRLGLASRSPLDATLVLPIAFRETEDSIHRRSTGVSRNLTSCAGKRGLILRALLLSFVISSTVAAQTVENQIRAEVARYVTALNSGDPRSL